MTVPEVWPEDAEPPVPEAVRRRIPLPENREGPERAARLLEAGIRRLRRALDETTDLERGGAFELLAADALLTWAAEAAVDEHGAEEALRVMAERVARAGDPPGG